MGREQDRDGASRRIGNPHQISKALPPTVVSTPRKRSMLSATTSSAAEPQRPIGKQPPATGVDVMRAKEREARLFGLPDAAANRLPSLAPVLQWRLASVIASDGQFDHSVAVGIEVRAGADPREVAGLLAVIEAACQPDDGATVATRELAKLRRMTASRASDDADVGLMAAAYIEDLSEYPPDVIEAACTRWRNRERWFPAWADLKAECDRLVRGRHDLRNALRKGPPR